MPEETETETERFSDLLKAARLLSNRAILKIGFVWAQTSVFHSIQSPKRMGNKQHFTSKWTWLRQFILLQNCFTRSSSQLWAPWSPDSPAYQALGEIRSKLNQAQTVQLSLSLGGGSLEESEPLWPHPVSSPSSHFPLFLHTFCHERFQIHNKVEKIIQWMFIHLSPRFYH